MSYYSTNDKQLTVNLEIAVTQGLAKDKGLYMPTTIPALPPDFFAHLDKMTLQEIAFGVAESLFGEDISPASLRRIVEETLSFDIPLRKVKENIYSLELFHGPTLAFKDVGARFMARVLAYFTQGKNKKDIHVLVATSGDTGSAVANGFLGVEGIKVFVLYPKGLVSKIQEAQFTTLGKNVTALEIEGTFDDCQRLVKSAFMDDELQQKLTLTSANSINVARFLPQAFYYFYGVGQLKKRGLSEDLVCCVPSGNFGNITAALIGKKQGLPIKRFIAANNCNDVFLDYLRTGTYTPRPSVPTIANAMDVGDPSNFVRILDLYDHSHTSIAAEIAGISYTDEEISSTIKRVFSEEKYLLDPHGACAYQALEDGLKAGEVGLFIETAHPAKFLETVENAIGEKVSIPAPLLTFMKGNKENVELPKTYEDFKSFLLEVTLNAKS